MANKRAYKKAARTAAKHVKKAPIAVVVIILLVLAIVAGVCFYLYKTQNPGFMNFYNGIFGKPNGNYSENDADWDTEDYQHTNAFIPVEDQTLSIHFLELGNEYAGDCVYIKAGDTDILVDAGSRASSVTTIKNYVNQYVTDGILEYVIVTHADRDHIAGFAASNSLFEIYDCKTIIDFARTDKTTATYYDYVENRQAEIDAGAKHYTALECWNNQNGASRQYQLAPNVTLDFLYQKFYENSSADENNYSVCFMITENENKHYLFTGDLEYDGEQSLVEENNLPEVELFKAGHHGSKTSSNDFLLSVIKPKVVCVCCCAGSIEYTQNNANTFPTQDFINRVAPYTDKVYVTSRINVAKDKEKDKFVNVGDYKLMNGNIVVKSNGVTVTVKCSHNDTILKDTEWFKNKRECPPAWNVA